MTKKYRASKTDIYGNCKVLHPDGTLMFLGQRERVNWYLKNGLADVIQYEPLIVKLTFLPNGKGHDGEDFFLQERENRCVVCGSTQDLTRHHVVPYCFRKTFPTEYKTFFCYDILVLCIDCHEIYESKANILKQELFKLYNYDSRAVYREKTRNITKAFQDAAALIKHSHSIPEERRKLLQNRISQRLNKKMSLHDIYVFGGQNRRKFLDSLKKRYSEQFDSQKYIKDLDTFILLWREHFVNTMDPKFLPSGWRIDFATRRKLK